MGLCWTSIDLAILSLATWNGPISLLSRQNPHSMAVLRPISWPRDVDLLLKLSLFRCSHKTNAQSVSTTNTKRICSKIQNDYGKMGKYFVVFLDAYVYNINDCVRSQDLNGTVRLVSTFASFVRWSESMPEKCIVRSCTQMTSYCQVLSQRTVPSWLFVNLFEWRVGW